MKIQSQIKAGPINGSNHAYANEAIGAIASKSTKASMWKGLWCMLAGFGECSGDEPQ